MKCDRWACYTNFYLQYRVKAKLGGVFTPDSIILHLYIKNIVLAQKLTKLQHFKENSSHFQKESSKIFTFTMKEYVCNLLVIELCVFVMDRACIMGYLFIFERGGY